MIRFEQAMPFVLLIATAVSFLTLFFGLNYVVRPLRTLGQRASAIGAGQFDAAQAPVGGVDEIEELRIVIDQMAHQLQSAQVGMESYLHAVTQAQDEERTRLARELHDETVQTLIALDHKTQMVQRSIERDPARAQAQVVELRQMVLEATAEVRRFSRALRPPFLDDLGLAPALELLAEENRAEFVVTGQPRRLPPESEMALYRIAQESLSNARRHANASEITVAITYEPHIVRLEVIDNGKGFEPPANLASLGRTGHFGLLSMQERAQLAGATLTIASAPGAGAHVTVSSPVLA
ncbi:MAG: HAMP domain-containing protein [Anaerolineales bacterium]|nr:HAMP domain-containing protein [Anaerolineales bacterium]